MSQIARIQFALFSFLLTINLLITNAFAEPTLKVGDPAPKITISKWFNGEGVQTFESGKVYIVEFWSTWCGPCIEQIPHLNELAKKYAKDVVVIGIADRERAETIEERLGTVTQFLETNKPAQEYLIGFDGTGQMHTNWQMASGARGIPNVYIIDRDGTVAFMDHPVYLDLDKIGNPIKQIVEGTWKGSKAQAANERRALKQKKMIKMQVDFQSAMAKKDWEAALIAARIAAKEAPFYKKMEAKLLIENLSKPEEAIAILKNIIQTDWDDTDSLSSLIELLVHEKLIATPYIDLQLAYAVAKRTLELLENPKTKDQKHYHSFKWFYYPRVAEYYFAIGQIDQAIHFQQMAVDGMPEENKKDHLESFTATLKKYQAPVCVGGVCELPASNCDAVLDGKK